jgi:hypothetical protein
MRGVRTGHGFYPAIPFWDMGLAFSLHLAWYHGTVVKVTIFCPEDMEGTECKKDHKKKKKKKKTPQ